ncbi:MAG: holo-ACP synthase [Gemmatimonadota bacterium]
MILGVGIDHVDAGRIGELVDRFGERGERRLFTERELDRCSDRPDPTECLAARFAAKEAFVKALGTGLRGMRWTDVEVRGSEGEPPRLVLYGGAREAFDRFVGERDGGRIHVSLTHEAGSATAVVVLEAATA